MSYAKRENNMPKVDKEKCIGCGLCTTICPEVFELGADGKSEVKKTAKGDEPCIDEAMESCPSEAISK